MLLAAALALALCGVPAGTGLAARAAEGTAFAPGTDGTLLLAGTLEGFGLARLPALWSASWSGLPLAAAAGLALARPERALACAAALMGSPFVLAACADGYGLSACALLVLWAQVLLVAHRPPETGLPLLGGSVLVAAALVPSSGTFALPLFAVLYLALPALLGRRAVMSAYLVTFLPGLAWAAAAFYAGWLTGAEGAAPLAAGGLDGMAPAWRGPATAALGLGCAPGLLAMRRARAGGLAALGSAGLAVAFAGAPVALALLSVQMAGFAAFLRFGGARWASLGLVGGAAAFTLL